jgi:hypothetical protein
LKNNSMPIERPYGQSSKFMPVATPNMHRCK